MHVLDVYAHCIPQNNFRWRCVALSGVPSRLSSASNEAALPLLQRKHSIDCLNLLFDQTKPGLEHLCNVIDVVSGERCIQFKLQHYNHDIAFIYLTFFYKAATNVGYFCRLFYCW